MSEPMLFTGRCACGAVALRIGAAPIQVRQCWCRHCQQLAAGAGTTNAIFPADAIEITGEVSSNAHRADSGNDLHWSFCPRCGSQLTANSSARPHLRVVRLGAIDRPHGLAPNVIIWTSEAPDWATFPSGAELFPGQPPALPSS